MTALIKYEAACLALAEAHSVDEVVDIRDKAEAMRVYAIQSKNVDLEVMAAEIRVRGERRLGELLIEAKGEGRLGRGLRKCTKVEHLTLDQIGIDRKLSSRAQKLAHPSVSEQAFDAMINRMRDDIRRRGSRAAMGALTTEEKQERRANRERVLGACQLALPGKKYGVIVADPEWRFEPWSRDTGMDRAADNHYPTSCLDVIKSRDVASIAAQDCILFLWATVPMLPHALAVMEVWGFDYRSHCVWIKDRIGTGYWFRNKHELLLVGVRGNVPAPAMGTQWDSAQGPIAVQAHSQKPDDFLMMIEAYFPTLPKIELNRRGEARKGWDAWGNEAVSSDLPPHNPETGEILGERMTEEELLAGLAPLLPPEPIPDIPDYLKRGRPDCPVGAKP